MRITAEAKLETRRRILSCAKTLFAKKGYAATTTRDISGAALAATGTLFNYFPSKEALGMALVEQAVQDSIQELRVARAIPASLEEALFSHTANLLRHLASYRSWVAEVLDAAASPFRSESETNTDSFRRRLLEVALDILERHAERSTLTPVTLHLYWTLQIGVLGFWCRDPSTNQEDTLVLLDQSLRLFARALKDDPPQNPESQHVT
jgi:AcrR family transcriptional regulator